MSQLHIRIGRILPVLYEITYIQALLDPKALNIRDDTSDWSRDHRARLPDATVLGNYDIIMDISHFFQPGIEILWHATISSPWRINQY